MISSVSNYGSDWLVELGLLKRTASNSVDLLVYYGPRTSAPDYEVEMDQIRSANLLIRENFIKVPEFNTLMPPEIKYIYDGWAIFHVYDDDCPSICFGTKNTPDGEVLEIYNNNDLLCGDYAYGTTGPIFSMQIPFNRIGEMIRGIYGEMTLGCPTADV